MKKNLLVLFLLFNCIGAYAQVLLPYNQSFEDTLFPPTGWSRFSNTSDAYKWVRNGSIGGYGYTKDTGCAEFNNFETPGGATYGIYLPVMDFSNVTKPYLRFDIAYAMLSTVTDAFGVWGSTVANTTGTNLASYSGDSLSTAPPTGNFQFFPQYNQWKTITIPLSGLAGRSVVQLSFVDSCHDGNSLYIDNVVVFDSTASGINTINVDDRLSIYPDPFDSQINVVSNQAENIARVEICNMLGEILITREVNNAGILINNLSFMPDGFYLMRVYTKEGVLNKKVVKCTGK